GLRHDPGIGLRQPAGAKGINHDGADGGSRNAAGRFGHVGHGELSFKEQWEAFSNHELSAVESRLQAYCAEAFRVSCASPGHETRVAALPLRGEKTMVRTSPRKVGKAEGGKECATKLLQG